MQPRPSASHRPREWRRRVVLPARLRTDSGWSDACILNISSRGLLIHAKRPTVPGSTIELRHGEHAIVARVMWSNGPRVGLRAEERLPVEQILSLGQAPALQLTAVNGRPAERRKRPRTHEDNRARGRLFEFAAIAMLAAAVAGFAFDIVHHALSKPLDAVLVALGG
jgi:hypothetical protein